MINGRTLAWLALAAAMAVAPPDAASADDNHPDRSDELSTERQPNTWVPEDRELQFGAEPLEHVEAAASQAAESAQCAVPAESATAMLLAMTWPETSPSGEPPSPMTLSRWDYQPALGDPLGRAPGLWFHPGIGMWQLDSAGLGSGVTAAEAMDTRHVSEMLAPYVIARYCDSLDTGDSPTDARADAWRAWHACSDGACENTYQRALAGITPIGSVGRLGGAAMRRCWYRGAAWDCAFVDPAKAEGSNWWVREATGRSPVAAPFYVFKLDGDPPTELRYWLAADSGADLDVAAARSFGTNARDGLAWTTGEGMCDLTEWRGDC